jgi:multiple sugar transport system ATP-binding protein
MKDGWVQQVGEPLELYGKPANRFVAGFIGSPAMNFVEVTIADSSGAVWAESPGLRIRVPAERAERLRAYKGQRLTLGIRPEDLRPIGAGDGDGLGFDAVVDVVEPLGSEILLDVKAGTNSLVARVDPTMRVKVHEGIRLAMMPGRLHFFDAKTEAAV